MAELYNDFQIPADFTDTEIGTIAQKNENKFKREYQKPPYAITITPLRVLVFVIIVILLIFGLLPAPGLKKSKHIRTWIMSGIVIGALIGGYCLGVTKSYPSYEGGEFISQITHIHILEVSGGFIIGGILGICGGYMLCFIIRRAIHNMSRIFVKSSAVNNE
jgi:hypothetical protein